MWGDAMSEEKNQRTVIGLYTKSFNDEETISTPPLIEEVAFFPTKLDAARFKVLIFHLAQVMRETTIQKESTSDEHVQNSSLH